MLSLSQTKHRIVQLTLTLTLTLSLTITLTLTVRCGPVLCFVGPQIIMKHPQTAKKSYRRQNLKKNFLEPRLNFFYKILVTFYNNFLINQTEGNRHTQNVASFAFAVVTITN